MTLVPATSVGSGSGGAVTQLFDSTLGGSAASFDITGIAQTANHLQLIAFLRGDNASTAVFVLLRVNGDTTANYAYQEVTGNAAAAGAAEGVTQTSARIGRCSAASAPANSFSPLDVIIPHYAQAANLKSWRAAGGPRESTIGGALTADVAIGYWILGSFAAITQLTIFPSTGNFVAGSRLSLYGIT